ncbi:MAG: hypothetical protein WB607_11155, partial [Candidatus Acidiferrum sp.]
DHKSCLHFIPHVLVDRCGEQDSVSGGFAPQAFSQWRGLLAGSQKRAKFAISHHLPSRFTPG